MQPLSIWFFCFSSMPTTLDYFVVVSGKMSMSLQLEIATVNRKFGNRLIVWMRQWSKTEYQRNFDIFTMHTVTFTRIKNIYPDRSEQRNRFGDGFKSKRIIDSIIQGKKCPIFCVKKTHQQQYLGCFTKFHINTPISSNCQSFKFIVPEYTFIFFPFEPHTTLCTDKKLYAFDFFDILCSDLFIKKISLFHELSIKCQFSIYFCQAWKCSRKKCHKSIRFVAIFIDCNSHHAQFPNKWCIKYIVLPNDENIAFLMDLMRPERGKSRILWLRFVSDHHINEI